MSRRSSGHLLCALAFTAFGQQASAPANPPQAVFRATTKLVQVSVIAQDKDGKPVAGLQREDFQLFDNGKPQPIQLFIAENPPASPPEPLPANTFTNRSARSTGYSVLLFDSNSTLFEHTARIRQLALKALQEIPPDDKIAIYSLWCQFRVVREFTSDRESLLQDLNAFKPATGGCASGMSDGTEGTMLAGSLDVDRSGQKSEQHKELVRQAAAAKAKAAAEASRISELENDSSSDQELQHLADHLAGIPGRKNLIWLADGFPLSPAGLRKLIDAGAAVYPGSAVGSTIAVASEKRDAAMPLLALAAITGGIANVDNDDLDVFIRKALNDGRISYTLGFYQSNDDPPPTPGKFGAHQPDGHQISVQVSRPGITLRHRSSYSVEPPSPPSANPVADLVQAMNRPADETAIGITATTTRTRLSEQEKDQLDLTASIDVSALNLEHRDGLWLGSVELVARFMTDKAVQAGDVVADTASIKLSEMPYQSMLKTGFAYHRTLTIPPNAVELKFLVGNLASGKIGSLTIPLSEVGPR